MIKKTLLFGLIGVIMLNIISCEVIKDELDTDAVEKECQNLYDAISDFSLKNGISYSLYPNICDLSTGDRVVNISIDFIQDEKKYNFGITLKYYLNRIEDVDIDYHMFDPKEWDDFSQKIFIFLIQTLCGSEKISNRIVSAMDSLTEGNIIRLSSRANLEQESFDSEFGTCIRYNERKKY